MRLTVLAVAVILSPVAAFAQSTSGATSSSSDQAIAVVEGGNGDNGGQEYMHESGHLYGTPNVGGSYSAFANPCGLSSSASGAGGPIGLSFSAGYEGSGCTTRASTAGFLALGLQRAAIARFCQDQENADAYFAAYGVPCIGQQNKARYRVASNTTALAQPTAPPPVISPAPVTLAPKPVVHTAWTLSPYAQRQLAAGG